MAPPRKPAHLRGPRTGQHAQNRPLAELTVVGDYTPPTPIPSWLKATKESWETFWAHPIAKTVEPVDVPALERLFTYRDMWERAWRQQKKNPFITGSRGQPVANPAFVQILALEKAMNALEDRIGLTAKARANLGTALGQAALTAADLNRMATETHDDHDDALEVESWEDPEPRAEGL